MNVEPNEQFKIKDINLRKQFEPGEFSWRLWPSKEKVLQNFPAPSACLADDILHENK